MKHVDEYRDGDLARALARRIADEIRPGRRYNIMEFCGGHTHTIARYGIEDLLPKVIRMIHGPGCPVCVLPIGRIDQAIALARRPGVILCTYGDMMRVPGSGRVSLLGAKAEGADVRMVYSTLDALAVAEANPDRTVVFFAIGFETTTPPTASALKAARERGLGNFLVLCNHVLTPAAMHAILDVPDGEAVDVDGFVGPGHVSTVIGSEPYDIFAAEYQKPVVISGFEPLDIMQAVLMLVRQLNEGRHEVENQYTRAVERTGNRKAQDAVGEVFELRPSFEWRGFGALPNSALRIRDDFGAHDAERHFAIPYQPVADNKACECAAIVRGRKHPTDCKLFGTVCTPEAPVGSCMVSGEGACAAHWLYGRFRDVKASA